MLQPSRVKHRKVHKGTLKAAATRGTELAFGAYGLKAEESTWVKANQLESARRAMSRLFARGGKIWIRVYPDKPRTAKSAEIGMGGGTGALSHFVSVIESGRIDGNKGAIPAAQRSYRPGEKLLTDSRLSRNQDRLI